MSWRETRNALISDLTQYSRRGSFLVKVGVVLFSLPFQTIALYRLIKYLKNYRWLKPVGLCLTYLQQRSSGCYIHHMAEIGNQFNLPHPTGIVIGADVRIGDNVTIYQNVTIGSHGKSGTPKSYPIIDDNVIIFAGAVIVGDVQIGKGAIVGANSVVLKNVPPGWKVAGVPAIPLHNPSIEDY